METRAGHQGRQALHELQRLHDDMSGAVFVRTLQLQHDLAGAITFEPFVSDGRPSDIPAELLEFQTLIGAPAHRRMEALKPCALTRSSGVEALAAERLFLAPMPMSGPSYFFGLRFDKTGLLKGKRYFCPENKDQGSVVQPKEKKHQAAQHIV
jgi:hypothetical protein